MFPSHDVEPLEPRRLFSGVTLITHGQGGGAGGTVAEVADLIAQRAGGAAQYVMTLEGDAFLGARVQSFIKDAGSPSLDEVPNGEMIIKLDFSAVSSLPITAASNAVADYLLANRLVEQSVHLAGPSRGGSLISNLAAKLGERDLWVDQVTYLDPVPAERVVPGVVIDGPMRVTDNVIFADNYWRSDENIVTGFDGQHVDGAHEGDLNSTVQIDNDGDPHVGVAAYYIATIIPTAPIVPPARASWFKGTAAAPNRDETGYVFTRIAGGERPADGLHPEFGGNAHRDVVARSGTQWANISDVAVVGGVTSAPAGATLNVDLRYGDRDSTDTVSVFLDVDQNPYNGNTVTRLARRTVASSPNDGVRVSGSTVEASPGTYFVYAQIADADGHVRYAYQRDAITLTTPDASDFFVTKSAGQITVAGTPGNDRILAVTNGFSLIVTRRDFTQSMSLAGVRRIVFDVGAGSDSVVLGAGVQGSVMIGSAGNDTLIGADFDDSLFGGLGNDRLLGGGGRNLLEGQSGSDFLDGGSTSDVLSGGIDDDQLFGGNGNDHLFGGAGSDVVNGGSGTDDAEFDPLDTVTNVP
jgi:Ca2+-binding RTX toxin-like protein